MEKLNINNSNTEKSKIDISEEASAQLSLSKNRGLEGYRECLLFNDKDLEGKKILDLGSGQECRFAYEITKKLPNTDVTSFDFSFDRQERIEKDFPEITEKIKGNKFLKKVSGLFTNLPFENSSFDIVVSSAAMPLYLNNREQIEKAFKEVIRVLRVEGKAYIGPVSYTDVINTDPNKTIHETHRRHSEEESKKLFKSILNQFGKKIIYKFTSKETKYIDDGDDYGLMIPKIVKPMTLVITKKF